MQRQEGHYLVKKMGVSSDQWVLAQWFFVANVYMWGIGGSEYKDSDFSEINETRILSPDETFIITAKEAAEMSLREGYLPQNIRSFLFKLKEKIINQTSYSTHLRVVINESENPQLVKSILEHLGYKVTFAGIEMKSDLNDEHIFYLDWTNLTVSKCWPYTSE